MLAFLHPFIMGAFLINLNRLARSKFERKDTFGGGGGAYAWAFAVVRMVVTRQMTVVWPQFCFVTHGWEELKKYTHRKSQALQLRFRWMSMCRNEWRETWGKALAQKKEKETEKLHSKSLTHCIRLVGFAALVALQNHGVGSFCRGGGTAGYCNFFQATDMSCWCTCVQYL